MFNILGENLTPIKEYVWYSKSPKDPEPQGKSLQGLVDELKKKKLISGVIISNRGPLATSIIIGARKIGIKSEVWVEYSGKFHITIYDWGKASKMVDGIEVNIPKELEEIELAYVDNSPSLLKMDTKRFVTMETSASDMADIIEKEIYKAGVKRACWRIVEMTTAGIMAEINEEVQVHADYTVTGEVVVLGKRLAKSVKTEITFPPKLTRTGASISGVDITITAKVQTNAFKIKVIGRKIGNKKAFVDETSFGLESRLENKIQDVTKYLENTIPKAVKAIGG